MYMKLKILDFLCSHINTKIGSIRLLQLKFGEG